MDRAGIGSSDVVVEGGPVSIFPFGNWNAIISEAPILMRTAQSCHWLPVLSVMTCKCNKYWISICVIHAM